MRHRVRIEAWGWGARSPAGGVPPIPRPGGGASKLQLPSKWEGGTGSGPSWGWDVVAEHPCPGRVRPGANRGLRLPPFRASQKVLHRFTCPLKEPLFDHLEFRGELFQARRVLPAPFEKSFLLLKKLLSGITRFYYPQKYSTFFDGQRSLGYSKSGLSVTRALNFSRQSTIFSGKSLDVWWSLYTFSS